MLLKTSQFEPGSRSRSRVARVLAIALVVLSIQDATAAEAPTPQWSRAFTATPIDTFHSYVAIHEALTAPEGGVVIVGTFHGSIDFGDGALVSSPFNDTGTTLDVFAASFDSLGTHLWSRVLARIRSSAAASVANAIDSGGNIVMVGVFESIDFGGTTLTSPFSDAFAAKFDADGAFLWGKKFGITGPFLGNGAADVAIDTDGSIVMVGRVSGQMDFGGGVLQSGGGEDVFLAKLAPDGSHIWSRRFGGTGVLEEGRLVALDGHGGMVIGGRHQGGIDFGGGPLYGDDDEIFLAAFDSNTNHEWSRSLNIGTPGSFILNDVAYSAARDVAVTTLFSGSIDLGGEVVYGRGGVVARYDPTGTYRRTFLAQDQYAWAASMGRDESLVVSGTFGGTFDLGGAVLTSDGLSDGYLARFDADGGLEWAMPIGGDGHDSARPTIRARSDLWVVGTFGDGIDLGDAHYDGSAAFLVLFSQPLPAPDLSVSLIPTPGNIEVRWNVTSEQPLDSLTILRGESPTSLQPVFTTAFETGSGSFIDHGVVGGRRYQYQLVVTTLQGVEYQSSIVTATSPAVVFANSLAQNAPNPFNPSTSIVYSVSQSGDVTLEIYDVSGAVVRRIEQGVRDAGEYSVDWDGRDEAGNVVGTGVYFYRLVGVSGVAPRKMVLLK